MKFFCSENFCFLMFALFNLCYLTENARLNKPRVLLPLYSQYPNNFTLEVDDGGCYQWSTKTPNVVGLVILDASSPRGCSSKAVVSAVTNEDARHTAIIFAEDINTGEILRCDVIVDSIASLGVVTRTREIFIEEAPEVFEVRAFDSFGNEFTTLDGFVFDWSVSAVTKKGQPVPSLTHKVIKLMKFEESHYKVPSASLAEIESAGLHGNRALLYGIGTGQARVTVSLQQPQYESVKPSPDVILAVVANLVLDPQDTLLMPETQVNYHLYLVKQGRLESLRLPSEQYQLEVENTEVAKLEEGNTVLALKLGRTRVLLRDNNAAADDSESTGRTISAIIRVAQPALLKLDILPTHSWYAVVGKEYQLQARVLDANKHAFHVGNDIHISISVSEAHFMTLEQRTGEKKGRALRVGSVLVEARLRNTKLTAKNTLIINDAITVIPENTYLPWIKSTTFNYKTKLFVNVKTGDDHVPTYTWQSKTPKLCSVNQEGLVVTVGNYIKPGDIANISVALSKDPLNFANAAIHFLPPCSLYILHGSWQAEIGSTLNLPISLVVCNERKQEFKATNCQNLKFDVSSSSKLIYDSSHMNGESTSNACTTIPLSSNTPVTTKVTVSLDLVLDDGTALHLEDTAVVGFYNPLHVVYPSSGETVLAPGTSRNIIFEGGPKMLSGQMKRQLNLVKALEFAQAWDLDHNSINVVLVRVQCTSVGNTELHLTLVPVNDDRNILARGSVKVFCAFPYKVVLTPNLPEPDLQHCTISSGSYVALANTELEVVATIYDRHDRKFDNISSITVDWTLSPSELAPKLPKEMLEDTIREETYGLMMPGRMYHSIKPWGIGGTLNVQASLSVEERTVSGETTVLLVEELSVAPSKISIYNHTSKLARLKLYKGSMSCLINVLEGEEVADVQFKRSRQIIEVTPRRPGRIRLSVMDACLPENIRTPLLIEVNVVGAGMVQVTVASQVQIGNTVEATLSLISSDGESLSPPASLPLIPHANEAILNVKQIGNTLKFSVTGVSLGDSQLKFKVDDAESEPTNIHVFHPIKIWPRDMLLVPGSILQALTHGGPRIPDATLTFSATTHTKPAAIHSSTSGKLEALHVGTSSLSVRAIAPDSSLYAEDAVPIKVVSLSGIEIWVPTSKLEKGCRMPAYVQGKSDSGENISPFVIATLDLKFAWTEHVGSLLVNSQDSLVEVEAINVGVAKLTVEVILKDGTRFSNSMQIEVIPLLQLTLPHPSYAARPILIAPNSKVQLVATSGKSMMSCGDESIISVSSSGLVTSHGPLGSATVTISDHKIAQQIKVSVQVVPIHYIMIHANSPLNNGVFPRGMRTPANITFHDSIGREIFVAESELDISTVPSLPQVLTLNKDSLQLGEPGHGVLDIWSQNLHAYLSLRVTQVITPLTLATGDHACYTVGHPGEWSAQPSSILQIDSKSGWAVAHNPGDINVQFTLEEGGSTWAEVKIQPASAIQFITSNNLAFNIHEPLIISFLIKGSGQHNKRSNLIDNNCGIPPDHYHPWLPVECRAAWEDSVWDDSLKASVSYNFKTGYYFCNVTTELREHSSKVTVSACLTVSPLCSEKLSVPFYKSLQIEQKEIIIDKNGGQILIKGQPLSLARIKVEAPPGLDVSPSKEVAPGTLFFLVSPSPVFWTLPNARKYGSLVVSVSSSLTGQTFMLPVVVEDSLEAPSCPRPLSTNSFWKWLSNIQLEIIVALCTIIMGLAGLHVYWTSFSYSKLPASDPFVKQEQNVLGSPFIPRRSFISGNGSGTLNTSGLSSSGSDGPVHLPYGTNRIYGNPNITSWSNQGGNSPRLVQ